MFLCKIAEDAKPKIPSLYFEYFEIRGHRGEFSFVFVTTIHSDLAAHLLWSYVLPPGGRDL